jgi:hypothetical protein
MRQLEDELATAHDNHTKLDTWSKTLIERITMLEAANEGAATYIAALERQLPPVQSEPPHTPALTRGTMP